MLPLEIHIPLKIKEVSENVSLSIVDEKPITFKIHEGGKQYPIYDGPTVITPKVMDTTELETRNKLVLNDILVEEIPYYETENPKGLTFIIGG